MKKFLSLIIVCIMALTVCIPTFATSAAPAEDITDSVKFATALEIYSGLLPVVRTDAQFISCSDYINSGDPGFKAPGSGTRRVTMFDVPFVNFFNDRFVYDISKKDQYVILDYPSVWQNNYEDGSPAKFVYNIDIPKDGIYEFVVVGCAQIKAENVDNDAMDRGFSISVDGENKKQVNISDTQLAFRSYTYDYSVSEIQEKNIITANGVNSYYYQVGYVYNIQYELTKGSHTVEYYHLEYSGSERLDTRNDSRLNFMGIYVQEYLTDVELALYKYPETSEIVETEETTKEKVETKPAVTTSAKEVTAAPTEVAETTKAPAADVTTKADETKKSGCGSFVGGGAVVLVAIFGSAIIASKRK